MDRDCSITQEVVTKSKPIPQKNRNTRSQSYCLRRPCKIGEKRRDVKCKAKKEGYTQLNAEFQSIARRDKKDFLSDKCKEIEENNRIGKTRDLVKKIGDAKGKFHTKMGTIKDRNHRDLTKAEEIKKRGQEYTEEL